MRPFSRMNWRKESWVATTSRIFQARFEENIEHIDIPPSHQNLYTFVVIFLCFYVFFFAIVPDSILGLLIGTFWMTVHIECFGIQPALSYCCHHFQLNKICIAMISDKYDDHTSQSLHATSRNHERFFMAGSQATGAGIPCQRSTVPSCGSIEPY